MKTKEKANNELKEIGDNIRCKLQTIIDNPKSELEFCNVFELLIAVMLSAQCTDKRVNIITRELFKVCKTPSDVISLSLSQLEDLIKSCNYYHNKAKNIMSACRDLVEKFDGKVPDNYDDLISLSGVGNKTANVVLSIGFGKNTFAVDTHILRVSNRLGLCQTDNPTKCENIIKGYFREDDFGVSHHLLLLFGRYYCTARNPKCEGCVLRDMCKFKD